MSSTTASLTRQTRTASRTSSATEAVCTWEGHCLGDPCSSEDDCDRDWVCASKTCITCCVTDSEPTFFSTFSTSELTTTSSSSITSSLATPSPTSSATITPTQASSGGLSAGAAAGIGIGGAALLILCCVGGWWTFVRRKTRNQAYELGAVAPLAYDDDRKELYQATAQAQELPTRHPPVELHAIELAELQGSDIARPKDEGKSAT